MRIGRYSHGDEAPWVGVRREESVVDLRSAGAAVGIDLPRSTRALLGEWRWQEKAGLAVDSALETGVGRYDHDELDRHAPVGAPEKVVCVGLNYADHVEETDEDPPEEPVLFSKFPTSVVGPDDDIAWDPDLTDEVDFEAELVAVVGDRAREVSEDHAMDHVAGYTVGNDVSARDLQFDDGQWVRGKSLDTFAPTGPELVTSDEVADPEGLDIWTDVNGERLQDSSTEHLVFGVAELVAFCSRAFTLSPGDLVFTGTPPGVGAFRDPPIHLDDGDRVTVGVEGIGELTSDCRHR
ncbi:fumarylacetoacetate hydrolase family protein [Halomarina litorea]|uniref:fumarylacetoacetate hydrolase family protein n=1 Tax=Halomarina litorea TaxID=2961595 RepID=UPI0020C38FC2|nr:fumarylacetoacetate hydrolase family protein [Halomarina sp. BCD28]